MSTDGSAGLMSVNDLPPGVVDVRQLPPTAAPPWLDSGRRYGTLARAMQGDPRVLERLVRYLRIELTGHKQYMLHAALCRRHGYARLAEKQEAYRDEESRHAARMLHRILLLGGTPELADVAELAADPSVEAQLRRDHRLVSDAIAHLRESIAMCAECSDGGSRVLLEEMLVDEEDHVDWLETQLSLIEALGVERYLQEMI